MKPELDIKSKYPEITKERLLEIVLQQASLIQKMQDRIVLIEQEISRLKTGHSNVNASPIQPARVVNVPPRQTVQQSIPKQTIVQQEIPVKEIPVKGIPISAVATQQDDDKLFKVVKAVFHTSWMAVLLGIFIEAALVIVVSLNGVPESFKPFVADLAQKMSWAYLVCIALTLATVALKFRIPVMGVVGFLAAPLAFVIARALHAGARYGLGLPPPNPDGTSPVVIAAIKAAEYGVLGAVLALISKYSWGRALAHIWVGAIIAVLFGGAIVAYSVQAAETAVPALGVITRGVSEFIFPIGCALIAFLAQSLSGLLPQQRTT
jgi:hypothetical protein